MIANNCEVAGAANGGSPFGTYRRIRFWAFLLFVGSVMPILGFITAAHFFDPSQRYARIIRIEAIPFALVNVWPYLLLGGLAGRRARDGLVRISQDDMLVLVFLLVANYGLNVWGFAQYYHPGVRSTVVVVHLHTTFICLAMIPFFYGFFRLGRWIRYLLGKRWIERDQDL